MKEIRTVRLPSTVDIGLLSKRKNLEAKLIEAKRYLVSRNLEIKPLIGLKKAKDASVQSS